MTVRARVWSSGRWHKPRGPHRWNGIVWHFEVYNSRGDVVLYDDTGDYRKIIEAALVRVEALRHMEIAGHKLKPYRG